MEAISKSSKVMIIFGALTIFIAEIKDVELQHAAKRWFKLLRKYAFQMYRELNNNNQKEGELVEFAFDEYEVLTHQVVDKLLDTPIDELKEFVEHINNFKNEKI